MSFKFTFWISAAAFAALAYCTVPQAPAEPVKGAPQQYTDKECSAKGGSMQTAGRSGAPMCMVKYKDAGKSCKSDSDCKGQCRVALGHENRIKQPGEKVAGVCQATNSPFGCFATVEKGVVDKPMMCVD
jgi:hypothetical protein